MDDFTPRVRGPASSRRKAIDLRDLLSEPEPRRGRRWLRCMLQFAIRLEFATIPPYLTAMWSIKDLGDPVSLFLSEIVRQEMLHMGLVCNLMNAVGGAARIASRKTVPRYPTTLPGGVHPGLRIGLRRLSKRLVADVFMAIEAPENGPITWFRGQTYPTIGAFYSAIQRKLEQMQDAEFGGGRQITLIRDGFKLLPIGSRQTALEAVQVIKEQGEGTSGSPLFSGSADDVAHYYRFGEIYHERLIKEVAPGQWRYCGDELPFPTAEWIYPMAPIPAHGYPESLPFDQLYTEMLRQMQAAWDLGGDEGGLHLVEALRSMGRLGPLAVELMQREITPGGECFGPCFRYLHYD